MTPKSWRGLSRTAWPSGISGASASLAVRDQRGFGLKPTTPGPGEQPLPPRSRSGRLPLLAGAPGLRLVGATEAADAAVVPSTAVSPSADGDVPLTPRELEVLVLLAEGASNKLIARRLGISVHTAKFHVSALLDKLDAVGRTDAVAHAARRGVINL
jgi:DNA-binding CsgD family transcriptional regulator